jgi:hypothetical protein
MPDEAVLSLAWPADRRIRINRNEVQANGTTCRGMAPDGS